MIKKCKQCGSQLKADESNNLCENCRKQKRNSQEELKKIKSRNDPKAKRRDDRDE